MSNTHPTAAQDAPLMPSEEPTTTRSDEGRWSANPPLPPLPCHLTQAEKSELLRSPEGRARLMQHMHDYPPPTQELTDFEKEWVGFPSDGRAEKQGEIDELKAAIRWLCQINQHHHYMDRQMIEYAAKVRNDKNAQCLLEVLESDE